MSLWSRWQTSSRESRGLYCRVVKSTGRYPTRLQHEIVRKDAFGLEALARSHFTALRRRIDFTHRGLHRNSKDESTVTTACLGTCWPNWLITTDRLIRTDTRATHPGQERCAPPKAEYICADLSSRLSFFLAVGRRTIHFRPSLTISAVSMHFERKTTLTPRSCFVTLWLNKLIIADKGSHVIFRAELGSDPTISPIATSTMITTSNSLLREQDSRSSGR